MGASDYRIRSEGLHGSCEMNVGVMCFVLNREADSRIICCRGAVQLGSVTHIISISQLHSML
jgi:hypothetical protein